MLRKIRIDLIVGSEDEVKHEVIDMPSYDVKDIDGLLQSYDFTEDEAADIRQRFDDGLSLRVFQDGSAIWDDGEMLLDGSEAISDSDFQEEARRAGSHVEL